MTICRNKITAKQLAVFAGLTLMTGVLFAAGYDFYRWAKTKVTGKTMTPQTLGAYIPAPRVVTFDNKVLRRYS